MLGGTLRWRKSTGGGRADVVVDDAASGVFGRLPGAVGASVDGDLVVAAFFVSVLVTRTSRMLIDSNLVTSELKKLLRMHISSTCCCGMVQSDEHRIDVIRVTCTYDCVSAFTDYHVTQRTWKTDASKLYVNFVLFYQIPADESWQNPVEL